MRKGDGTIEFYSNLNWLKEQYETGFVVAKRLHEKAVSERGFKMSYKQFGRYFNEIFKPKKEVIKTPKNQKSNEYLVIFSSLPSK